MRRDIDSDEPVEDGHDPWYEIEGQSFMLRYAEVDTLNLIYSLLSEEDISEEDTEEPDPS